MSEDGHPWLDYRKDSLPGGLTYLVGRDRIEVALRQAGATLGWLSLARPDAWSGSAVASVHWAGDGGSRYFGMADRTLQSRLSMSWHAVPSEVADGLRAEVTDRWLPEACAWAAAAPGMGNVWQATDHAWTLWFASGTLRREVS